MMISLSDRVENIVGKGKIADYQHFLIFPQCFQKGFFHWVVKSWDCVVWRESYRSPSDVLGMIPYRFTVQRANDHPH